MPDAVPNDRAENRALRGLLRDRESCRSKKRQQYSAMLSATGSDPDHSLGEERFITFGVSTGGRLLVIAHTERGNTIRIISARPVTPGERRIYEEGWSQTGRRASTGVQANRFWDPGSRQV